MRRQLSFSVLFDDAAVFPPGNLGLPEAVEAHRLHLRQPYADLVGPLVIGLEHLGGLEDLLGESEGKPPLDVAVVVDDPDQAVAALELDRDIQALRVVAVEIGFGGAGGAGGRGARVKDVGAALVGAPRGTEVTTFLEVPRGPSRDEVIADIAASPYLAKIRTGGLEASMYPDESELATTLRALATAGVPFKATAGLHHAVRGTETETGFEQHGVLNLIAATQAAGRGAPTEDVAALLSERDPSRLVLSPEPVAPDRLLLRSIGTCSITEPVEELTALGILVGRAR